MDSARRRTPRTGRIRRGPTADHEDDFPNAGVIPKSQNSALYFPYLTSTTP